MYGMEQFIQCLEWCSFRFELLQSANILRIHSVEDAKGLSVSRSFTSNCKECDFERLISSGIDVIDFKLSMDSRLYFEMYGLDCDCILVLNPDVAIPTRNNKI